MELPMRPIIIGAGRGRRLNSMTDHEPKCYVRIGGRRILDGMLEALEASGLGQPVFIGGYLIDVIRADYPHVTFCHNDQWEHNNILDSLLCANEYMDGGFVCTYADILYRASVVRRALDHPGDIVLCVDVAWRDRYADRSEHPEADAEKIIASGDRLEAISRGINPEAATGEYIGVAKFTPRGVEQLREQYGKAKARYAGRIWKEETPFEKAYLIHLLETMVDAGVPIHVVTTAGDYMEVDTEEDYALANERWEA